MTVAGSSGIAGHQDGNAPAATFDRPTWIAVDGATGDLFVVDRQNGAVRRISKGSVTTVPAGSFDFDGAMSGGVALEPPGVYCGVGGGYGRKLLVVESGASRIDLMTTDGVLANEDTRFLGGVEGNVDGTALQARFRQPTAIATEWNYPTSFCCDQRHLYVADTGNNAIRKLTRVADLEGCYFVTAVQTLVPDAHFNGPRGVAAGPDGSVYVADTGNGTIRRIRTDGTVETMASGLSLPTGIDVAANGDVYFAETGNHVIRRIVGGGTLETIAGAIGVSGFVDGDAATARFAGPVGVKVLADGSVVIADTSNNAIRRWFPAGEPRRRGVRH